MLTFHHIQSPIYVRDHVRCFLLWNARIFWNHLRPAHPFFTTSKLIPPAAATRAALLCISFCYEINFIKKTFSSCFRKKLQFYFGHSTVFTSASHTNRFTHTHTGSVCDCQFISPYFLFLISTVKLVSMQIYQNTSFKCLIGLLLKAIVLSLEG